MQREQVTSGAGPSLEPISVGIGARLGSPLRRFGGPIEMGSYYIVPTNAWITVRTASSPHYRLGVGSVVVASISDDALTYRIMGQIVIDGAILFAAIFIVFMSTYALWRIRMRRDIHEVQTDGGVIIMTTFHRKVHSVRWEDLREVSILTQKPEIWDDDYPFLELRTASGGRYRISDKAKRNEGFMERLQQLPGFDHGVFTTAKDSTEKRRFMCWKGKISATAT